MIDMSSSKMATTAYSKQKCTDVGVREGKGRDG